MGRTAIDIRTRVTSIEKIVSVTSWDNKEMWIEMVTKHI
jgi:hypothetical protein